MKTSVLLIDNYDSFVHNVARLLRELGASVDIRRSDRIRVDEAVEIGASHVVISPGPCTPAEAGVSVPLIRALDGRLPVLGICLGHQAVVAAYGGEIIPSPEPVHGKAGKILHDGRGILAGLPSPFEGGLYHSLSASPELPEDLVRVAWTGADEVMGVRHSTHPVWGVQFHPESILTPQGHSVLGRFLALRERPEGGRGRLTSSAVSIG